MENKKIKVLEIFCFISIFVFVNLFTNVLTANFLGIMLTKYEEMAGIPLLMPMMLISLFFILLILLTPFTLIYLLVYSFIFFKNLESIKQYYLEKKSKFSKKFLIYGLPFVVLLFLGFFLFPSVLDYILYNSFPLNTILALFLGIFMAFYFTLLAFYIRNLIFLDVFSKHKKIWSVFLFLLILFMILLFFSILVGIMAEFSNLA